MKKGIIIGLLLVSSLLGCSSSSNNITPNADIVSPSEKTRDYFAMQTVIAYEQITNTPTPVPTGLSNLPKQWTEINTLTPNPLYQNSTIAIAPRPNSIIYRGPGTNYRMACYVQEGIQLLIVGRTTNSEWLRIILGQNQTCITMTGDIIREDIKREPNMQFWILDSSYTVQGDLSAVPINTPPTP